ncbi:MAG: pyridoxal phosphate-dependent aminotransferase [Gammaproteobacteria bacterium]|nr:pyridoxal phosphate-dependent aminotransferase [Gammaproteobacteria bacterium]
MSKRYSQLCQRLDRVDDGADWAVHDRALELKRAGEDVVLLSIGDPDFRTPDPIIDNAVSHMRVGRTHYSPALGELNLRRAVADYETRVSPHACSVDEVAIFPGVTAALFAVLSCLLNRGDDIVVVDPQYVGYAPILRALDVNVHMADAIAEHGFKPQLESIVSAVTPDTRVILINTPANPTGAIIDRDTLKTLATYCQQRDIWLVCDEVYSMFTFDEPHVSLRTAAEALDNLVVIDGLSKSHAMSGWRMGWTVTSEELTHHLGNFAAMSMFGCPQFIQDASAFALNNDEYYVAEMRDVYKARRDAVCERLEQMPGVGYLLPKAGMFVMVDVSGFDNDDRQFAQRLLDAERVSLLPGSVFGENTRGHARFSLVQPVDILLEGCDRLQRFIS